MDRKLLCVLPCLLLGMGVGQTSSFTINDTDSLYANLLKNYNKNTRGTIEQTRPTVLSFLFYLVNINQFDEVTGTFSIVGFFDFYWTDERMRWNASDYNGVSTIIFSQADVWTPTLLLGNGNGENGLVPVGQDYNLVRFTPEGTALWSPGDLYEVFCAPNIKDYPYDTQKCLLNFLPWGYATAEIEFYPFIEECNTDLYAPNGAWDLKIARLGVEKINNRLQQLLIKIEISRRPTFYFVNMILPISTLGALNLLVFLLPAESGERVGYSITLLLAICVFLTIASDNLPKSSYPSFSFLCVKLLVDTIISSFVMLATIVGLRFYHKDNEEKVPACIAAVASCVVCRCCRRQKKARMRKYESKKEKHFSHLNENNNRRIYQHEYMEDEPANTVKAITWTDVGVASDIVFFTITLLAFVVSQLAYFLYVQIV